MSVEIKQCIESYDILRARHSLTTYIIYNISFLMIYYGSPF